MLQSLVASVPWAQLACSPARVTLYGGQEPATSTIFLGGYSPQRAEAGSGRGASRYEWGGQWQTTISRHAGATFRLLWSQEWGVGLRHVN